MASLRFARKLLDAERAELVRQELATKAEEEAERARNAPPKPPEPPKPPKPPRWKSLPTIDAIGEVCVCPFCGTKQKDGCQTWQSRAIYCSDGLQSEYDRARVWLKENNCPATVGGAHTVLTDDGPRIYQCCLRCQAEWLARPDDVLLKPKTNRPKVPSPPSSSS